LAGDDAIGAQAVANVVMIALTIKLRVGHDQPNGTVCRAVSTTGRTVAVASGGCGGPGMGKLAQHDAPRHMEAGDALSPDPFQHTRPDPEAPGLYRLVLLYSVAPV
jgi:hypothetical protein